MNDFTLDELHKIANFIEYNKRDSYDDIQFKEILNKLKSMIENFEKDQKTKESLNYILSRAREWGVNLNE